MAVRSYLPFFSDNNGSSVVEKALKPEELKVKLSIRINPKLFKVISASQSNKSKYFEILAYQDLLNTNKIDENFIL